jgi:hypothetical protein
MNSIILSPEAKISSIEFLLDHDLIIVPIENSPVLIVT